MEPLQPSKSTLIPPLQIVRLQPSKTTWKNEGFTPAPSSHTPTNLRSPDPSFPSSSSLQPPCAPFKPRATTPTPSVLDEPPKWLRMASLIRPSEQPAAGGVRLISVTSAPQKFFCLTKLPEGSTLVDLHTCISHLVRRLPAAWRYTALHSSYTLRLPIPYGEVPNSLRRPSFPRFGVCRPFLVPSLEGRILGSISNRHIHISSLLLVGIFSTQNLMDTIGLYIHIVYSMLALYPYTIFYCFICVACLIYMIA